MNRTALVAAVGSSLLALFYFITNALPVLRELDSLPALALVQPFLLLLLPQLLWTGFFLAAWRFQWAARQAALVTLVAGVAPQMLDSWVRTWPTFSLLSIDSILYLFSGVIQPLAYSWFLLAVFRNSPSRVAAYSLWVLTTFQALALILTGGSLEVFLVSAILIFHAGSQSFFFRSWRRGVMLP